MKNKTSLFLLCLCSLVCSCTLILKGLARAVVKDYDNYISMDLSDMQLIDPAGEQQSFSKLFAGKTVYLYLWNSRNKKAPDNKDKKYYELKQRFEKYPDVVFANISLCKDCESIPDSYRLAMDKSSVEFRSILNLSDATPFIIGKNGKVLAFKGPKPSDDLLVDYVLYESRKGVDGTTSARKLIRGVNSHAKFKTRALREWYAKHFNKDPSSFDFNFSSTY